jgi:SAM-dependent methyltransferase
MTEWEGYYPEGNRMHFAPGMLVLDVGCGNGYQMKQLLEQGNSVIGLDPDLSALMKCRSKGLAVLRGQAERVPLKDSSLDGILCQVVLPYTREEQVIGEFGRLLKPGGRCYLTCHGAGYSLKYSLFSPVLKHRFYGLRTLVNTWLWVLTGRRLPGFLGDTIYQSRRRLAKYFREHDLSLLEDIPSKRFLGFPVFTFQSIEKAPQGMTNQVEYSPATAQSPPLTSSPVAPGCLNHTKRPR